MLPMGLVLRVLDTFDDRASENVAPPCDAPCGSSPESSKVAKPLDLSRKCGMEASTAAHESEQLQIG